MNFLTSFGAYANLLVFCGIIIPGHAQITGNSSVCSASSVSVSDLRTEYLLNPLGIDSVRPRLSWRLDATNASSRGQRQTAYQVLVASREELLNSDVGDMWDSGWKQSADSQQVEYQGKALVCGAKCCWKVRVKDEHGVQSDWSDAGVWTMGPLSPADWRASWIGAEYRGGSGRSGGTNQGVSPRDPWLRKELTLAGNVARAEIHASSIGYHELYVNGRKASDAVLAPAVSDHLHRARYVTYDIAPLLRKGENTLAIWLGASWSVYPWYQSEDKPRGPIAILQGEILLEDESVIRIGTDASWKTHPSPNRLLGAWEFRGFVGEHYDSRLEECGWNENGYDDSDWPHVKVYSPRVRLSSQMVEADRIAKRIAPVSVERSGSDSWRVDMGVNFAGFLELDVAGEPGTLITIRSSERAEDVMTHGIRSEYVIGQDGVGTFRSRFNYHSGRWLTIEGLDRPPQLDEVRGCLIRTDFARTGRFVSSDASVNEIYDLTLWTLENLSVGGYIVDCPHRERMGYGGDAHATILTALKNYRTAALYTKWNQDWHDVQQESGFVPYTAPTYWGGGGPAWSGFCVTLPWEVYRHHGDKRILEQSYPHIKRWLAFLDAHSRNDLLVQWGSQGGWVTDEWSFLGDWVWPGQVGTNSHTVESLFFNNCYWIHNLQTAADIATVIGQEDDATEYRALAAKVRRAVHAAYYDPGSGSYVDGSQGCLAIALIAGVPPEDARLAVWGALEQEIMVRREGHIHAGITAGSMLLKALMEKERHDLIHEMATQPDYPGWLHMLNMGATTVWEAWEPQRAGSRLHSSFLYIGAWPLTGLAGIRPGKDAGFSDFEIRPGVFAGESPLEWVRGQYHSDYGPIESSWQYSTGQFKMTVSVPPNTTAVVLLPTDQPGLVKEAGLRLGSAQGVERLEYQEPWLRLRLLAGRYRFEAPFDAARWRPASQGFR